LTAADETRLHDAGNLPDAHQWMAQVRAALERGIVNGCDMGALEKIIEHALKELGRPLLEEAVQKLADRQALSCPHCGRELHVERHQRGRNVSSVFGKVPFKRSYGFCPNCRQRFYPADHALGLQERAPASPRVQEICALMVLESPAGQAEANIRRLTGLDIGQTSMHREARRQGERALKRRDADVVLTNTLEGLRELTERADPPKGAFTLVIEVDAWHIRERDDWGESEQLRKKGEDPSRWHWVYTGTIFRLDQRGKTASGRTVITERGYVATRQGLEAFEKQLYAEALQRGLSQATSVLVLADGAAWIWNIAQNRFKEAVQRVDFWHVSEHLWTVARDLYGQGTPEARQWVEPLLRWLKRRKDGALDVIGTLQDIRTNLDNLTSKQCETLDRELGYLDTHKDRMDYKNAKALDQPLGSGAMESTCAQYQCRFKRTGQFWSLEGDEAFLALVTLHRNGRWQQLFPHDQQKE
jgi:Uncharacterised protein family (UPF0236)